MHVLDGGILEGNLLWAEFLGRRLAIAQVKVLGAAPRVHLESLGYLEVLLVTVELLDEVLLVVVDAESKQIERPHTMAVSAVVQLVDQVLCGSSNTGGPGSQPGLYDAKNAQGKFYVGVLHGEV